MNFPVVNGLRGIEFGTPGDFREELIALVLSGQKRATAGLLNLDYLANNEPIEFIGENLAVLNTQGEHVATIQVTRIDVTKFIDVPDEFALAEGEGDLTGDDFRESHLRYWSKQGIKIANETEVVLMYFELVS